MGWLAVRVGAALGAWLRWRLSVVYNIGGHFVPVGTLAAN